MFTSPDSKQDQVTVFVDGQRIGVPCGASAAAAALMGNMPATRQSPVDGRPRAPYCLMGVCFECLMVIDGEPNQQACMIPVRDGMTIAFQHGAQS